MNVLNIVSLRALGNGALQHGIAFISCLQKKAALRESNH